MPIYTLNNLYSISDFNGLTNLQYGTFTLNAASTPDSIKIWDNDPTLEDTSNAGAQSLDGSQQRLDVAYDGHGAGTAVRSRATGEIDVTQPDGTIYTLEMNQILIGGQKYFSFQHDVPAGSTFKVNSWEVVGNTPYTDLDAGDPIVEHAYNQLISDTLANQIIAGGAIVNEADLSTMFLNDQDGFLEDNNNNPASGQTLDANIQNLSQDFKGHDAGAYVFSRLYYSATNTVTGETGRLYQIRVSDNYDGVGIPPTDGIYWAFSKDFNIGDGSNITVTSGPNNLGNVEHADLFVCFSAGTLIETDCGDVAVEDLSIGDVVKTADNGYQSIRWIGSRHLNAQKLDGNTKLRPIRIREGALGHNQPSQDLVVSPQHRVLINSNIARRMLGTDEVLVAAKQLVMLNGVDIAQDLEEVTYVHFLCDQHEVVYANGAATESLYTGPEALKSVSPESRKEILTLFPELSDINYKALSARTLVKGSKGRRLALRHKNNNKPLVRSALH